MKYELPIPPDGYKWRYKKDSFVGDGWIELIHTDRRINKVAAKFTTYLFMSPDDFLECANFTVDRALEIEDFPVRVHNAIAEANSQRKDNNG